MSGRGIANTDSDDGLIHDFGNVLFMNRHLENASSNRHIASKLRLFVGKMAMCYESSIFWAVFCSHPAMPDFFSIVEHDIWAIKDPRYIV